MSETAAPAPKSDNRVNLKMLLEKVEQIAQNRDADGLLPSEDSYDKTTAPPMTMVWCASVIRIFLLRVIEHIIEARRSFRVINDEINGRAAADAKDGKPAVTALVGLHELRSQVAEMFLLVQELVEAINTARGLQSQAKGASDEESTNPDDGGSGNATGATSKPLSAEEVIAAKRIAELDGMAAELVARTKNGSTSPAAPAVAPVAAAPSNSKKKPAQDKPAAAAGKE